MTEIGAGFKPMLEQIGGADANAFLNLALESTPSYDLGGYMMSLAERQTIARNWAEFATRYPIILGPVNTQKPFPVGFDLAGADEIQQLLRSMRLLVTLNLLGLPAAVVPVGMSGGLPQSVQLIGGRFREDLCLAAAEAIEDRLGIVTPIDPR